MKGLSLSGGSTKIAGLAGAVLTLYKEYGYRADFISGISAGSIIALPLALGMYDEIQHYTLNFDYDDFFSIRPVNKKGKPSLMANIRFILGKQSFGSQDNLLCTLSNIITPEIFEKYKNGNYANCYLGAVEYRTGQKKYFDIKNGTYEDYLCAVLASSSIPVYVESVEIKDGYWYDGGIRDHIGSHWLMDNFNLTEHISIYSRPKDYDVTDINWKPKNVTEVLLRTIEIMNVEISKNDEFKEDQLAKKKNINNKKIFMPKVLSENTYDLNPELLQKWFNDGVDAAHKYLS